VRPGEVADERGDGPEGRNERQQANLHFRTVLLVAVTGQSGAGPGGV
jgi:hypothetical protein